MMQFSELASYVQAVGPARRTGAEPGPAAPRTGYKNSGGALKSCRARGKATKHLGPLATYAGEKAQLEPWISQGEAKVTVDHSSCPEVTRFFMLHNHLRGDWSRLLSTAEFAYNDSCHAATGISPFQANYGLNPRRPEWPTTAKGSRLHNSCSPGLSRPVERAQ